MVWIFSSFYDPLVTPAALQLSSQKPWNLQERLSCFHPDFKGLGFRLQHFSEGVRRPREIARHNPLADFSTARFSNSAFTSIGHDKGTIISQRDMLMSTPSYPKLTGIKHDFTGRVVRHLEFSLVNWGPQCKSGCKYDCFSHVKAKRNIFNY